MEEPSARNDSTNPSETRKNSGKYADRPEVRSQLLTLKEARLRFRLSVYQIYKWASEGLITPVAREGHQTYYLSHELEGLVAKIASKPAFPVWFQFDEGLGELAA